MTAEHLTLRGMESSGYQTQLYVPISPRRTSCCSLELTSKGYLRSSVIHASSLLISRPSSGAPLRSLGKHANNSHPVMFFSEHTPHAGARFRWCSISHRCLAQVTGTCAVTDVSQFRQPPSRDAFVSSVAVLLDSVRQINRCKLHRTFLQVIYR